MHSFRSALCATVCGLAALGQASQILATVDLEVVIRSHPGTEANKRTLRQMQVQYEEQRDALKARVDRLQERFVQASEQAGSSALSDAAREVQREIAREVLTELRQEEENLRRLISRLQRSLSEKELELFEATMEEVEARLRDIATEKKLSMVIDTSAVRPGAPVPVVLWADPALDLTEELVRRLGGVLRPTPVEDETP